MLDYYIIGVGPGDPDLITKKAEKVAYKMNVLAGGKRQLSLFSRFSGTKIVIGKNLEEFWERLHNYLPPYGILASGDPLLYSIGEFVLKKVDKSKVEIIPGISTFQYLLAKEKSTYWHVEIISNHWKTRIKGGHFKFFLNPSGEDIEENDIVGQDLSLSSEIIEGGRSSMSSLSISMRPVEDVILFGLSDELFEKGSSPMTKREVRTLIISTLSLKEHGIFWDLGAGLGTISCEVARLSPSISVYAIEKRPERVELIRKNVRKLGLSNVYIIKNDILNVINHLPIPCSVFVGGGGKDIVKILDASFDRLMPGGKIVFSAIALDTAYKGYQFLRKKANSPHLFSVGIEHGKEVNDFTMMISQNRIFIGEGRK